MASITIRNLDSTVKDRLRVRAAEHGRSMEEEARLILRQAVGEPMRPGASTRHRVADLENGGVVAPPERGPARETVARRAEALLAIGRSWRGGADRGADRGGARSEDHAELYGEDGLPQ